MVCHRCCRNRGALACECRLQHSSPAGSLRVLLPEQRGRGTGLPRLRIRASRRPPGSGRVHTGFGQCLCAVPLPGGSALVERACGSLHIGSGLRRDLRTLEERATGTRFPCRHECCPGCFRPAAGRGFNADAGFSECFGRRRHVDPGLYCRAQPACCYRSIPGRAPNGSPRRFALSRHLPCYMRTWDLVHWQPLPACNRLRSSRSGCCDDPHDQCRAYHDQHRGLSGCAVFATASGVPLPRRGCATRWIAQPSATPAVAATACAGRPATPPAPPATAAGRNSRHPWTRPAERRRAGRSPWRA